MLLGKGDGTFLAHVDVPMNTCGAAAWAIGGDWDKNGRLDVAVGCPSVGKIAVFLGQ